MSTATQAIKSDYSALSNRYDAFQQMLRKVCMQYERPKPVVLAVSKKQSIEAIEVLLAHGHRHFAENRVQEAYEKWPSLLKKYPDTQLHLIGPLQSNKAKQAAQLFSAIHTLDRESLKSSLESLDNCPELFIQVNTGEEAQKSGVLPMETHKFIQGCTNLPVKGLMCIPPQEEVAAPHFAFLRQIAEQHGLHQLSMGMSNDWQTAVALGATHIRVGTILFGERQH